MAQHRFINIRIVAASVPFKTGAFPSLEVIIYSIIIERVWLVEDSHSRTETLFRRVPRGSPLSFLIKKYIYLSCEISRKSPQQIQTNDLVEDNVTCKSRNLFKVAN